MNIINIIILGVIVILIDMVYLKLFSKHFNNVVNNIQGSDLNLQYIPAILCYIFILFQLYYFIVSKNMSYIDSFILGLTTYGIFDLTNKAIFNNWDWMSVAIDTTWGGILYTLTIFLFRQLISLF